MDKNVVPSAISFLRQAFPRNPHFTERNVPDLTGKVIVVSGANSGIGKELSRLLYSLHARVYLLCRSESNAKAAIDDIKAAVPKSQGSLTYIHLDLSDLKCIRPAVETLLLHESRLDVLFNNAGLGYPATYTETAQAMRPN